MAVTCEAENNTACAACILVQQAWDWGTAQLTGKVSEPRRDAGLLLAHALSAPASNTPPNAGNLQLLLYRDPSCQLLTQQWLVYKALIVRRTKGHSVAVLQGSKGFWDIALQVTVDVLIPRPETEHLIEAVQEYCTSYPHARRSPAAIADIGTGSGALLVVLGRLYPEALLFGTDISAAALSVAAENGLRYIDESPALKHRLNWCLGSGCEPLPAEQRYDLMISNPPYLSEAEWRDLADTDIRHEPYAALVAGPSGMECFEAWIPEMVRRLLPGGYLVLEHGSSQQTAVADCCIRNGLQIQKEGQDWSGHPRFIVAQLPE